MPFCKQRNGVEKRTLGLWEPKRRWPNLGWWWGLFHLTLKYFMIKDKFVVLRTSYFCSKYIVISTLKLSCIIDLDWKFCPCGSVLHMLMTLVAQYFKYVNFALSVVGVWVVFQVFNIAHSQELVNEKSKVCKDRSVRCYFP